MHHQLISSSARARAALLGPERRRDPRSTGIRALLLAWCCAALLTGCTPQPVESSATTTTALAPTTTTAPGSPLAPQSSDALQRRAVADLEVFIGWLGDQRGYIGEVGWPAGGDAARWDALAERWYARADQANLWVTAWATGEWWGSYDLAVYGARSSTLDTALAQASVHERHRGGPGRDRGISVNGGEFGIGPNLGVGSGGGFSNAAPGAYDADYHYDSQASFNYLASRGVELVRLPFRWERLQRTPGGPLDPAELTRLRGAIRRAAAAGLEVIPTPMNYGAYWFHDPASSTGRRTPIGSTLLPPSSLADLWGRTIRELGSEPNVAAWGVMNEPTEVPGGARAWEQATQLVVDTIRAAGDRRTVAVPTYNWSSAARATESHPGGPWIRDPARNIVYEAHQYFDQNRAGEYRSYDQELLDASRQGY